MNQWKKGNYCKILDVNMSFVNLKLKRDYNFMAMNQNIRIKIVQKSVQDKKINVLHLPSQKQELNAIEKL